jgi:hypothetical protein
MAINKRVTLEKSGPASNDCFEHLEYIYHQMELLTKGSVRGYLDSLATSFIQGGQLVGIEKGFNAVAALEARVRLYDGEILATFGPGKEYDRVVSASKWLGRIIRAIEEIWMEALGEPGRFASKFSSVQFGYQGDFKT